MFPFGFTPIRSPLCQIFHIVAPLADNKSDEMGSPLTVSPTRSGTLVNGAS